VPPENIADLIGHQTVREPGCAGVRKGETMRKHYFKTECPRCGKIDEICCEGHTNPPTIKCGECLMNDVEVVALKITPLRREKERDKPAAWARVFEPGRYPSAIAMSALCHRETSVSVTRKI